MNYFYHFLEPISEELARTAQELEGAIYNSPRSMLTHSRTFIEAILERVMIHENMEVRAYSAIIERIQDIDNEGLLSNDVKHSLHEVRKLGNKASHDVRQFRFSESLTAWEHLYTIVKWYVEVYASSEIEVPEYVDPIMKTNDTYDLEEMKIRFEKFESLLRRSLQRELLIKKEDNNKVTKIEKVEPTQEAKELMVKTIDKQPGLTPVRTIAYKNETIDVPHFLRDAFLLPQRFEESERFLVRLGGAEEARIMSELPSSLEGFHNRVTRYNETTSETFFHELKLFIDEEIRRKRLMKTRPGELFLFYESDEIVVTEELAKVEINIDNFTGMPGLIKQLNKDGICTVNDLPKELVIIGKYHRVGKMTVESFFQQLKGIQQKMIEGSKEV